MRFKVLCLRRFLLAHTQKSGVLYGYRGVYSFVVAITSCGRMTQSRAWGLGFRV